MCSSPEAFVVIRSRFAVSYAALCIGNYILGIGDRHLENFLIDPGTGQLVGIDFGYNTTRVICNKNNEIHKK